MTSVAAARRPASPERPIYQWEGGAGPAASTLRLFGVLTARELALALEAILERARAPRDAVCVDFEFVEHLDYRALGDFARLLARQRERGASIWLWGMKPYVRRLFDVAGQGALVRQMTWSAESETGARGALRARPFGPRAAAGLETAPGGRWR